MKEISCDICLQIEPEIVNPMEEFLVKSCGKYKYIFTYNQKVLDACPNAKRCLYGTIWVSQDAWEQVAEKKFLITSITGLKNDYPGHKFRIAIYNAQEGLTVPRLFFRSCSGSEGLTDFGNNPILENSPDKNPCKDAHANKSIKIAALKDSQFHIVIENSRQQNYFSEKLCDALVTKNIPIYYGCPNIADFFDTTGWIILEDEKVESAFNKINTLTPEYYNKYLETINKNFTEVKQYQFYENQINKSLAEAGLTQ